MRQAPRVLDAVRAAGVRVFIRVTRVKDATAAFSADGMHAAHAVNGPTFAHVLLATDELLARLPA
ncbi:hypothetical protein H1235_15340 [Pseudoxanthomonas sp. NC8]|nr:hypothetical protein H1235_15340 [Pseudoxanthomonas sp. NC8]